MEVVVVVVVVVVMVVVEAKMEDGRWKMGDGRVATMMMTARATNDVNDGEHEGKRVVLYNWRCAIPPNKASVLSVSFRPIACSEDAMSTRERYLCGLVPPKDFLG